MYALKMAYHMEFHYRKKNKKTDVYDRYEQKLYFNFYRIIEVNILEDLKVFSKFCFLSQNFKDFCLKKFERFIN